MVSADTTAPVVNGIAPSGNGVSSRPSPRDGSGTGTPTGFQRFPVHNKLLDNVSRTPGRQPSPQPTHLGIPGGTTRVLSEEGPGYVAQKFEGKQKQMDQGMHVHTSYYRATDS